MIKTFSFFRYEIGKRKGEEKKYLWKRQQQKGFLLPLNEKNNIYTTAFLTDEQQHQKATV